MNQDIPSPYYRLFPSANIIYCCSSRFRRITNLPPLSAINIKYTPLPPPRTAHSNNLSLSKQQALYNTQGDPSPSPSPSPSIKANKDTSPIFRDSSLLFLSLSKQLRFSPSQGIPYPLGVPRVIIAADELAVQV
jgi:hypothetical protein